MTTLESTPLVLFSGLAADGDVFVPQKLAFPQLVVPKWPIPEYDDTLDSYCDRLADDLRPHGNAIIGGASFGGIVALHVAERLNPLAVLLIGSVRSPAELSRVARIACPLKPFTRLIPVRFLQLCCRRSHCRGRRNCCHQPRIRKSRVASVAHCSRTCIFKLENRHFRIDENWRFSEIVNIISDE